MQSPDFDRHFDAAGRRRRCAPWLGFASLGVVALSVGLTQPTHQDIGRDQAADAAIQAWRGTFKPAGGRSAGPLADDIPSLALAPDVAAVSPVAVDLGDGTAAIAAAAVSAEMPSAADDDELSSLAMMPSAADVLGAPPVGGTDWASDMNWPGTFASAEESDDEDEDRDESEPDGDFDPPGRHTQHKVGKGETLAKVLEKLGIAAKDRAEVIAAAKSIPELTKLKTGQELHASLGVDGGLMAIHVPLSHRTTLRLSMEDGGPKVYRLERQGEKRLSVAAASVQSSLYADGQDAGLSDRQIAELAAIFGWDVDFAQGIRAGDRFRVVYEAEYIDGNKTDGGDILAAEFVNKGTTYRAVRFEDEDGTIGYYAPDGTSKKQAFLRTPLKLARVTSGFSLSRFHPVLQERRPHKGVDYSAPIGTPVKATGTGVVQFSGRQNGYGNVIELQHGDNYTTVYGHLARFAEGVSPGVRVQQGQVIGYVGQTGLATGPHLHYEFRIAGQHRDPLSVKLPTATPLKDKRLAEFKQKTAPLVARLEDLKEGTAARAP